MVGKDNVSRALANAEVCKREAAELQAYFDKHAIDLRLEMMLRQVEGDLAFVFSQGVAQPEASLNAFWKKNIRDVADVTAISDSTLNFGKKSKAGRYVWEHYIKEAFPKAKFE